MGGARRERRLGMAGADLLGDLDVLLLHQDVAVLIDQQGAKRRVAVGAGILGNLDAAEKVKLVGLVHGRSPPHPLLIGSRY